MRTRRPNISGLNSAAGSALKGRAKRLANGGAAKKLHILFIEPEQTEAPAQVSEGSRGAGSPRVWTLWRPGSGATEAPEDQATLTNLLCLNFWDGS